MHRGLRYQRFRGTHWRQIFRCVLLRDGTLCRIPGTRRMVRSIVVLPPLLTDNSPTESVI